jgi:hypothetical protein
MPLTPSTLRSTLRSTLAAATLLAALAACGQESATAPTRVEPALATARWSDPASWPGGVVPAAGADVTIPAGRGILLDVSPPPLRALVVDGALEFDRRDLALTAERIQVAGTLRVGTEADPFTHRATITLTGASEAADPALGLRTKALAVMSGGTLDLHGEPRTGWTRLGATAPAGATEILLEREPGWRAGDRIVLAASDFDPAQYDEATVARVEGRRVTLAEPLRFAHWGTRQTVAGRTVDERAEVGLLTRNLVFRGDSACAATGFCAHVIAFRGATMRVEGAELTLVGQKLGLARYPLHWHVAHDVDGQYARNNSVWRSFNRCVTVHGSHGASVSGNVCHDHLGHGYFLEDGVETRNTLSGNLGVLGRAPAGRRAAPRLGRHAGDLLDHQPRQRGARQRRRRVAGVGVLVRAPRAPDRDERHRPGVAAAHAVGRVRRQRGALQPERRARRRPRPAPRRHHRGRVVRAARDAGRRVAGRGGELRPVHGLQAPRPRRVAARPLAPPGRARARRQRDRRHVRVERLVPRRRARGGRDGQQRHAFPAGFPVRGFEFYDGTVGAQGTLFANYVPSARGPASAFGYNRRNAFPLSTHNFAAAARYANANRVYIENPRADKDGDKAAVFLDRDGTVTGAAGRYVAANVPLLLTAACTARAEWNAHVCAGPYGRLQVSSAAAGEAVAPATVTRDDGVALALAGSGNSPASLNLSVPLGRGYALALAGPLTRARLGLWNVGPGDWVRVSLPAPAPPSRLPRLLDGEQGDPAASPRRARGLRRRPLLPRRRRAPPQARRPARARLRHGAPGWGVSECRVGTRGTGDETTRGVGRRASMEGRETRRSRPSSLRPDSTETRTGGCPRGRRPRRHPPVPAPNFRRGPTRRDVPFLSHPGRRLRPCAGACDRGPLATITRARQQSQLTLTAG